MKILAEKNIVTTEKCHKDFLGFFNEKPKN